MTEFARLLIEDEIEKRTGVLDLSECELTKIPKKIEELTWLTSLNLSLNKIQKIESLEKLVNLTWLNLSYNKIKRIENLERLIQIMVLDFDDNQIQKIENLDNLILLEELFLERNKISKIENLETLKHLKTVYLDNNQISKIENLYNQAKLIGLSLINNQISKIENLENLNLLQAIELGQNPIVEIPENPVFLRIPYINLFDTKIRSLSSFFTQILNGTQIFWESSHYDSKKSESDNIIDLEVNGFNFYVKKGIYVENCQHLLYPAPEWIQLGPKMVKSYFQAIEEQGAEVMNEVKVLLVGDGAAGKTSLAQRLAKPEIAALPKVEERTRGIDVFDWSYQRKGAGFLAHLWDFGGQVMYDMVHQYFYSQRSLYVLLESSRSGANEYDSRLNQLLQSAELFGRKSPMLMIQNEHSGHEKQLDFNLLQKHYPFLREFAKVNLLTKEGLDKVEEMIKRYIETIPSMGVVMPKKWLAIREEIKELAKTEATISLQAYRKICAACGVAEEKAQDILSKYFHQLGVFLHFPKEGSSLAKLIILNREWATKASYQVFDADFMKQKKQKGRFTKRDLKHFWHEPAFKEYQAELLDLMKEFEICYKLERSQTYLVPRMMDKMPDTDFCTGEGQPLHFYYEYTFMPEGLLNRLSVRLHDDIGGEKGDRVWSNGVVFEKDGRTAELREVRPPDSNSRIDIKIIGQDAHWMSQYLIMEIDKINADFDLERLKVEIKIPCICRVCSALTEGELPNFFNFRNVKADLLKTDSKFHSFPCEKSRENVDYHDLLKTISHTAIKEVEEEKKRNRLGKHGFEDAFMGGKEGKMKRTYTKTETVTKEPAGMAEEAIQQITGKIDSSTEQIMKHQTAGNQQLFSAIEKSLKLELNASDMRIIKEVWESKDAQALHANDAEALLQIVTDSLDTLLKQVEGVNDTLELKLMKTQTQLRQSSGIEVKDKIKLSIGILYGLVKLEKEVAVDNFKVFGVLRETWGKIKVGDWKGVFVEE